MKKGNARRKTSGPVAAKRTRIPFNRILTACGLLLAVGTLIHEIQADKPGKMGAFIGGFEITDHMLINLYYLQPDAGTRNSLRTGILPLDFVNTRSKSVENLRIDLEARRFITRKTILFQDGTAQFSEEKNDSIPARFFENEFHPYCQYAFHGGRRDYAIRDSISILEHIHYQFDRINGNEYVPIHEVFRTDTAGYQLPETYYSPILDHFTLYLQYCSDGRKRRQETLLNLVTLKFASLEELVDDCEHWGTSYWGGFPLCPESAPILNLIVCPVYRAGKPQSAPVLQGLSVYRFEYRRENILRKRSLTLEKDGRIFKKYKFRDSPARRDFLDACDRNLYLQVKSVQEQSNR